MDERFQVLLRVIDLAEKAFETPIPPSPDQRALSVTVIERLSTLIQVDRAGDLNMGDHFHDIHNSIIATRGAIARGVIEVREKQGPDVTGALTSVEKEISASNMADDTKQEALELLENITSQAKAIKPSKSVLKQVGNGLFEMLKSAGAMSEVVAKAWPLIEGLWK